MDALKAAGLPLSNEAVQDENTDPNNLIGRPNGYLSRASFDLPGGDTNGEKHDIDRGGVIEVFPTRRAQPRARSSSRTHSNRCQSSVPSTTTSTAPS
jgi:hypothetical protein